ncbi:MAG: hypothetical protein HC913_04820 [Microscillaceae bacterium]|nr:hypothetical protein [Microscillaceae bacterium]
MIIIFVAGTYTACSNLKREVRLSDKVPEIDKSREAKILTAFFGLDNALTQKARALYWKAPGKDGMPLVFSLEIDPATLDASDFQVISKDGTVFGVEAVTLLPAEEEFELRTVLFIGEYGNHPDNPPVTVKVKGDLMSRTGANFKGQSAQVIPLEEGPVLSYAEYFTFTKDYPYIEKGTGCDCPKKETQTIVKAVWSGGVRSVSGKELGENELDRFTIQLRQNGDTLSVHPFQIADLNDNDNNTDLCIKEKGIPILLEVEENTAIDPRDDKNAFTAIKIVGRWK